MTVDIRVRTGASSDAPAAAALHVSQIAEGFLARLGEPFLARLYRRVAISANGLLLIADRDGQPAGFAAITEDTRGFYREFLLRDGVSAGLHAAPTLVRSLPRAIETLRYGTGKGEVSGPSPKMPEMKDGRVRAEVLAVAVAPDARGLGIGASLVRAATDELTRRGIPAACVVAGVDNTAAIALYKSCGFTPTAITEIHRGQTSQVLTWS